MNLKIKLCVMSLLLCMASVTHATLISVDTTGPTDNGQRGVMFDINVGNSAISLAEMSTFFYAGTTADYEFYYIEGGMLGNESTPASWTLQDSIAGLTGLSTQITWDFTDLLLNANTTYGLYFTNTSGGGIHYKNSVLGQVIGSDSKLTILSGYGRSYAFNDIFNSRAFVGSLSYELEASEVSEPSILSFLALGLLGLVSRKFKK